MSAVSVLSDARRDRSRRAQLSSPSVRELNNEACLSDKCAAASGIGSGCAGATGMRCLKRVSCSSEQAWWCWLLA